MFSKVNNELTNDDKLEIEEIEKQIYLDDSLDIQTGVIHTCEPAILNFIDRTELKLTIRPCVTARHSEKLQLHV